MGLWGLHSEWALRCTTHNSSDGQYKIRNVNVCLLCKFWNTNDVTLNNHVRKHYNMGFCCLDDGFITGSTEAMRVHMAEEHKLVMRSGVDKAKQTGKKAAC